MLTNDIVSFEQLDPAFKIVLCILASAFPIIRYSKWKVQQSGFKILVYYVLTYWKCVKTIGNQNYLN